MSKFRKSMPTVPPSGEYHYIATSDGRLHDGSTFKEVPGTRFMRAARPPAQTPARTRLSTTPPPAPHSFHKQLDEAHAAIRELLALNDAVMELLVMCGDAIMRLHNDVKDYIDKPDELAVMNLEMSLKIAADAFHAYHAWLEANP